MTPKTREQFVVLKAHHGTTSGRASTYWLPVWFTNVSDAVPTEDAALALYRSKFLPPPSAEFSVRRRSVPITTRR